MARESTISIDQLAVVANKIQASGGKPNARSVREALGRGSMATVLKLLKQWQGGQMNHRHIGDDTLDPSVIYAISSYISAKVEDATIDLTVRMTEIQSDADMLIGEYERQTEELTTQTNALISLQQQYAEMTGRVEQLESDSTRTVAELSSERKSAEAARVALAKAEQRLEAMPRMETELDKVRAELLDARTQSALFSEAAAVAKAKYEAELEHRRRA